MVMQLDASQPEKSLIDSIGHENLGSGLEASVEFLVDSGSRLGEELQQRFRDISSYVCKSSLLRSVPTSRGVMPDH